MKNYRENWWDEKVVLGVTWNHIIMVVVSIALIAAYNFLDWDRAFGLR